MRKATTLIIEPLSLDEAYLDVTENLKAHPVCRAAARKITCLPRAYASRSPDGPSQQSRQPLGSRPRRRRDLTQEPRLQLAHPLVALQSEDFRDCGDGILHSGDTAFAENAPRTSRALPQPLRGSRDWRK